MNFANGEEMCDLQCIEVFEKLISNAVAFDDGKRAQNIFNPMVF